MAKTAMQEVREKLTKHFENFRFDKTHHLKFGDIKLTIWEQEEIVNMLDLEKEKEQIGQFMNWFIKHYSTATIDGMFGWVNSMNEQVTLQEILDDYYNKTYKQP
jgi:hypothetical protein